jgi:site-specific recombinase XerD
MGAADYDETVDSYLADCRRRGLRPATLRAYRDALTRFRTATEVRDLDGLSLAAARAFADRSSHLAPGSVRGFTRALKTFSRWTADEGLLAADPLARLRLPRVDTRMVVVPTDEELAALLAASAPALRCALAVIAGLGVRVSDLCALDLSSRRPTQLVLRTTKNRAGRLLPLDPVTSEILERYTRDVRPSHHSALFVTRAGCRLSPDAVRLVLADARRRAGLELVVSPHVLRHWFARDIAGHGTSDRLLAARMGWRSQELMARYAPVGVAEVERDVARYAPLVRLESDGWLVGLFPTHRGAAAWRRKNDMDAAGAHATASPRSRSSWKPSAGRAEA